jgi:hypothetical protein
MVDHTGISERKKMKDDSVWFNLAPWQQLGNGILFRRRPTGDSENHVRPKICNVSVDTRHVTTQRETKDSTW